MSDDVPNLRPSMILGIVQVAVTIGTVVAGLAWMAAKYPDRDEFRGLSRDLKALEITVPVLQAHVEGLRNDVGGVKAQLDRIENNQSTRKPR